jgi:hypothetical protein
MMCCVNLKKWGENMYSGAGVWKRYIHRINTDKWLALGWTCGVHHSIQTGFGAHPVSSSVGAKG